MTPEFSNVIRLLRRMTPFDRKSMLRQLTGKRKDSKDALLLRLINNETNEFNINKTGKWYLNELGYDSKNRSNLKKFTYRLKNQIVNYFSSESCHLELQTKDPSSFHKYQIEKHLNAAKIANEKGHYRLSNELLIKTTKLCLQIENKHLYVETLKQQQKRARLENNVSEFAKYQKKIDLNVKQRLLYDKASQSFSFMVLNMKNRNHPGMKSIVQKHQEVFENIHSFLNMKKVYFYEQYSTILILQLENKFNEALHKAIQLYRFVKRNELVFNCYHLQLILVKLFENLILLQRGIKFLINWNVQFNAMSTEMHQYLDLKILKIWAQFHVQNANNLDPSSNNFRELNELQLFTLEQSKSLILIHYHFKLHNLSRAIELINIYEINKLYDDSIWLKIQLKTIEIMTLIELKKYDACDLRVEWFSNLRISACDPVIFERIGPIIQILKNLRNGGFQFKTLNSSLVNYVLEETEKQVYPRSLFDLYSTQPYFFLNWMKQKIMQHI